MKYAESITDLIGGTPVVKLNRVAPEGGAELFAKLALSACRLCGHLVLNAVHHLLLNVGTHGHRILHDLLK